MKARMWYGVVEQYFNDGRAAALEIPPVWAETPPETEFKSTARADVWTTYYPSRAEAQEAILAVLKA